MYDTSLSQPNTTHFLNTGSSHPRQSTSIPQNNVGPSPSRSFITPPQITIPSINNQRNDSPSNGNKQQQADTPSGPKHQYQQSPSTMSSFFIYPEKIVQEGVNSCKKSLLGKIISKKYIHVNALKQGLASIRNDPAGLTIHEIKGNILHFFMDNKFKT